MRALVLFALCLVALGQDTNTKFEVASIRPSTLPNSTPVPARMSGGPGTADPERFTYTNPTVRTLLLRAYQLQSYELTGPDWLSSTRFDIVAKVPPGATEQQLNQMLRNLLAERFNLTIHHETKEMAVYELSVDKSGLKLKESDLSAPPPVNDRPGQPLVVGRPDQQGFPQIPPGMKLTLGKITNGIMRWTGRQVILSELGTLLTGELQRPVLDKTGLTGKYDLALAYSLDGLRARGPAAALTATSGDPSGGPTLFKAVQDQLGLKLESAKDPIDILVIDHIDKTPTDN